MPEYDRIPDVRKIAVLRANAIGDFLFTLPALEALRAAYPGAEIVLLGRPWHAEFLTDRPGPVSRVVVVPPSRGVRGGDDAPEDSPELRRFFAAMRRERFDLAVQLHGGGRHSNPFVRRLGARVCIGSKAADAPPLDRWTPYVYFQSEVVRFLEVVALAGAAPVTLEPRVAVTEADREEARAAVPEGDRPLAVLNPGARDPRRRWSPDHFAAVGDVLSRAGAAVTVTAGPGEQAVGGAVVEAMTEEGLLCGSLSLGGLAGLLERAAVVVSNDTGPLHLALAVGASAVGIYHCYNLLNYSPPFRARYRPLVSWRLHCPVCGFDSTRGRCPHDESFVDEVAVEEVADAALELLRAACRVRARGEAARA